MNTAAQTVITQITNQMKQQGLNANLIAANTGIPYTTLNRKLRGISSFTIAELEPIAHALQVQPAELFKDAA